MNMHAIKYHQFDCLGLLIGRKQGNEIIVENAIPLFHQRVMNGMLETAFDMVQSLFLEDGQSIVGLYEAAQPLSLSGGRQQSLLAQNICENIVNQFKNAVFI